MPSEDTVLDKEAKILFGGPNEWLLRKLEEVKETEEFLDAEIKIEGETLSVNITLTPLLGKESNSGRFDYENDCKDFPLEDENGTLCLLSHFLILHQVPGKNA